VVIDQENPDSRSGHPIRLLRSLPPTHSGMVLQRLVASADQPGASISLERDPEPLT
jgi:hypothetical protein